MQSKNDVAATCRNTDAHMGHLTQQQSLKQSLTKNRLDGLYIGGINLSEIEMYKGKAVDTKTLVEYSADSIVSKTLIDTKVGTITLFAFDAGQGLSEHAAPYDAVVQIIDGDAEITIGGNAVHASEGNMVVMPANIPHALQATNRFKMLLTMIRA